ncbi:MAG TPA: hypothetical protein VFF06_20585 [Polyangia bacterium]|nr:hypothetical protein [Polyangia bacterium]
MRNLIVVLLLAAAALLLWHALVGAQPKLSMLAAAAGDAGLIDWARRWLPVPSLAHG